MKKHSCLRGHNPPKVVYMSERQFLKLTELTMKSDFNTESMKRKYDFDTKSMQKKYDFDIALLLCVTAVVLAMFAEGKPYVGVLSILLGGIVRNLRKRLENRNSVGGRNCIFLR